MRNSINGPLLIKHALTLALLSGLVATIAYQFRFPARIDLGLGDGPYLEGFHAPESDKTGLYRWTEGEGQVTFSDLGNSTPLVLRIRASAQRFQDRVYSTVVTINGREVGALTKAGWRDWSFRVDDQSILKADQLIVGFHSEPFVPSELYSTSEDNRTLGVAIDWVEIQPQWSAPADFRNASDFFTLPSIPRLILLVASVWAIYLIGWVLGASAPTRLALGLGVILVGAVQIAMFRIYAVESALFSLLVLGSITIIDDFIRLQLGRLRAMLAQNLEWARVYGITLTFPSVLLAPIMRLVAFFLVGMLLMWYIVLGLYTNLATLTTSPMSQPWFGDLGIYLRAYGEVLRGADPYAVRDIGAAYLYPPPALFVIAPFASMPSDAMRMAAYTAVNLALLCLMLWGIGRRYGYSLKAIWWWFPLAFGFAPFLELVQAGQINIIASFGIFLTFMFAGTAPILAGAGLSLAVFTKVAPLVFVAYLVVNKSRKAISWTLFFLCGAIIASGVVFGWGLLNGYLDMFDNMGQTFVPGGNSQALVSVLNAWGWIGDGSWLDVQHGLYVYLAGVFAVSAICAMTSRQSEPFFLILSIGAIVAPSIMWYHHYVFILLPIFVWIAWSQFNPTVALWCFIGLVLIQVDRWYWTFGLLPHLFAHASILILLAWQIANRIPQSESRLAPKS